MKTTSGRAESPSGVVRECERQGYAPASPARLLNGVARSRLALGLPRPPPEKKPLVTPCTSVSSFRPAISCRTSNASRAREAVHSERPPARSE